VPGYYEGALRHAIAESALRRGALILPCFCGVIVATEPLSFISFVEVELQIRGSRRAVGHWRGTMWQVVLGAECYRLASMRWAAEWPSRRVCLL
jgi:hypothetical protein